MRKSNYAGDMAVIEPIRPPDCENFTGLYPGAQASYAQYPALNATIGGTIPFTIALWVRFSVFGTSSASTVASWIDSSGSRVDFFQTNFIGGVNYLSLMVPQISISIDDVLRKHWYYLALTYDGKGNVSAYVDGAPVGAVQQTVASIVNPAFVLGRDSSGSQMPLSMTGQVRNFAVWNTELTADEIMGQMWALSPTAQTSSVLIASDFTQSPAKANTGPTPQQINTYFQMEAQCLWPSSPLAPGQSTVIDPCGPTPFSLIAWIQAGDPSVPKVSAIPQPKMDPTAFGQGCIFSNRDQTDPQHLAVLLDTNGTVTIQFGTGSSLQTVSAPTVPIPQGQWANIAITYDGSLCWIYVNAFPANSGQVQVAIPASKAAPQLLGRLSSGAATDTFQGMLQYLSVWNIALGATQVASLMYADPTGVTGCVANFSGSESPPQDLLQLSASVWNANVLLPSAAPAGAPPSSTVGTYSAGVNPTGQGITPAALLQPLAGKIAFRNPRSFLPPRAAPAQPFGEEHRAFATAAFLGAASSITSGLARQKLAKQFEQELDKAFDAALNGKLPPAPIHVAVDGNWLTVTDTATGEVVAHVEVDMSPGCTAWWLTFVYTFMNSFLTIAGLPTPVSELTALALRIVNNPAVLAVLATVEGVVFTGTTMLSLLRVIYDFGYFWDLIGIAIRSLGWWGVAQVVAQVAAYVAPIPNPIQAVYIANSTVAVAQLVVQIALYPNACGNGEACAV